MLPRGTTVAGYRIDDVLGEGGMGVVYRATQLSLNRVVALKLLTGDLANDAGFRARFQREGQLQAALDDDHIVSVHEAGETEDGLFIAMRLVEGPTLKDLILAEQLDSRRALRLLAQVAQALDTAHEAGLIHRDIKPQNILIGRGDHAYLADFGLTKAPDDTTRLTSTGQFIGTIDYVAPEQMRGEAATAASDCYSLTAVLYESLTGAVPYERPNETATMYAHLTEPPPRISERRPDLPAALDEVIAAGMAKDPSARPSSARDLITATTRALASASPLATPGQETRLSPASSDDRGQLTRAPGAGAITSPATAASTLAAEATARPGAATAASAAAHGAGPSAAALETKERPARAARPAARSLSYAIIFLLAAAAVVIGLLVGRGGGGTKSTAFASSATVGHLQLRYPSSWQLAASAPGVPGITFTDPIVLKARDGSQMAAGEVADAGGATLLPGSLRTRVQGGLPAADPVSLRPLEAYRYASLRLTGLAGPVTIYAAPTSAGVATVACLGATAGFETQCAQVAATLRLVGATAYPIGPSPAYARLISQTFASLRAATSTPQSQLQAAGTPTAQASAARRLANAYTTAASGLSRATISPAVRDTNRAIIAALERIGGGYSNAAGAAASGAAAAFARAERQIVAGSTALSRAVRQLAALGYAVGS